MKILKGKIGKVLLLIIACLSIGMIASAANSTATEVRIAIEASEPTVTDDKEEGDTTDIKPSDIDNNQLAQEVRTVQTGDSVNAFTYVGIAGVAIALIGVCLFAKRRKSFIAAVVMVLSLFIMNHSAYAEENTGNVNVTVPSSISVTFDKSGENSISEFTIDNLLPVPVTINKVTVTECNDWRLCAVGDDIPVNTKMMAFTFENKCLGPQENTLDISIGEETSKDCNIQIDRGAWTTSGTEEKALQLEFEYSIGRKQFQLSFDANGGKPQPSSMMVYNGETVTLPSVEREGYAFVGWEDSDGNLYTDRFTMPMKDVKLTAQWKEMTTYAIYVRDDSSLRFVQSADVLKAGSVYNNMTVTAVYSGFENATYSSVDQVPWYDGDYYTKNIVKKVIVEAKIQPVNTAYWFNFMYDCEYFDVENLDTSKVKDMSYMFGWAGYDAQTLSIKGVDDFNVSNVRKMSHTFAYTGRNSSSVVVDLSRWNVSKVTNMSDMFAGMGYLSNAFSVGDLSTWNVSNVTNMYSMFQQTGYAANWYLDCRSWDVSKVTNYNNFDFQVDAKVVDPYWVN